MIVRAHYPDPFLGGFARTEYEAAQPAAPGDLRRVTVPHPAEGERDEILEITHVAEGADGVEAVGVLRLDALGDLRVLALGGAWSYLPPVADLHRPELVILLRRLLRAMPDAGHAPGEDDIALRIDPIAIAFGMIAGHLPGVGPRIRDLVAAVKGRSHIAYLGAAFDPPEEAAQSRSP